MINIKNKNVLVTGSSGFIGTNLISRLLSMGANVTATTFQRAPQWTYENVIYKKVDLTRPEECDLITKNQDYVFMCAANSSGAAVIENRPLTHLTPNVIMNAQMLASAYASGVKKFIFISSNTVYPLTDFAVSESDVNYEFYEKYYIVGWMKLFSEKMCEMYSKKIKNPMATLVIRPANLYGPFDKYNKKESKVIAALLRRFVEKENPLLVWGDGSDIKDFLYIDDFIDGLIKAFQNEKIQGPINLASGKPVTIREVVNILREITKYEINNQIIFDNSMPSMIPIRLINSDYAKTNIGWQPTTDIKDGLLKTYKWYLEYFSNSSPENKYDNLANTF